MIVQKYLEEQPLARERKNKNRALVNLLLNEYPALTRLYPDLENTKRYLIGIVMRAATLDRAWRKTLEEVPYLRGKDYDQKEVLEQAVELGLGYTPGHDRDVKTLQRIAKEQNDFEQNELWKTIPSKPLE